jgi:hypothetical protein
MNEEQREAAIEWAKVLRAMLADLEMELEVSSTQIVAIQWEQVQDDIVTLTSRMNAGGVH